MFHFDYVGKSKYFFIASLSIIAFSLIFAAVFGIQLDVQFKGGSIITYSYTGDIDSSSFKSTVEKALGDEVNIQSTTDVSTGSKKYVVTLAAAKGISSEQQTTLSDSLAKAYPQNSVKSESINVVDPTIGKEFLLKSLTAVAFASFLMVIYVGIRFKKISGWSAGVMALVALLHDVFIVFSIFIVFKIPLNDNFIAVVLTILGFSLNDTIVIYDRVRENQRIYGSKLTTAELMNKSIIQSLTRTTAASAAAIGALLVVCAICVVYHVNSIISFAFPMLGGMISGVYSTIFIAGPLWVRWQEYQATQKHKRA